jgi:FkbM family methyltransferase
MSKDAKMPFKMSLSDPISLWRAETFWFKEPETIEWLNFFGSTENLHSIVLVDVGANIGIYTLYWCSLNRNLRAISIEPFEENYKLLVSNVDMNDFTDRVKFLKQPLSSQKNYGVYDISDKRPGSSSFKFSPGDMQDLGNSKLIESLTLDILLNRVAGQKILKIDVDGNDFDILQGAEESLTNKDIVSILIESTEIQQYEIRKFLVRFGFEPDYRFNTLANHSDVRRKASDKLERNRIYTKSDLIN